jgi:redox-sensing transcriptional repressor
MWYYRILSESPGWKSAQTITSAQIAESLEIDPTQVRKDFGAIGLMGMGRVGFDVCEACRSIRIALGFDRRYDAVLIGTGKLGGALMAYTGFARYGLRIVAAFDNDKRRVGGEIAGCKIMNARSLIPFIRRREIQMAILTTPGDVSQKVTDRLVSAGVKAIWNFSPTRLTVPRGVLVRNEHISMGLSEIAYHLRRH